MFFAAFSSNGNGLAENHVDGFFAVNGSQIFYSFAISPEIGFYGSGKDPDSGSDSKFDSQSVKLIWVEPGMSCALGKNNDGMPFIQ